MMSNAFCLIISGFNDRTSRQIIVHLLAVIFSIYFLPERIMSQSIPYGQEFQANPDSVAEVSKVKIASFPDGSFVLCWQSCCSIMGRIFNSQGTALSKTFAITAKKCPDARPPEDFSLFCLDDFSFVVCWDEIWSDWWYYYGHCYAQMFDKNGGKIGEQIQLSTDDQLCNHMPVVTRFAENQIIVFWQAQKSNEDSTRDFIFGRVLDIQTQQNYSPFLVATHLILWPTDCYGKIITLTLEDGRVIVIYSHYELGLFGAIITSVDAAQAATFEFSNPDYEINDFTAIKQNKNILLNFCEMEGNLHLIKYNDTSGQIENSKSFLDNRYWTGNPDCFEMTSFNDTEYLVFWGASDNYYGCKINFEGKKSCEFKITGLSCIWYDRQLSLSTIQNDRFVLCYPASKDSNYVKYNANFKIYPKTSLPFALSDFSLHSPKYDETITGPTCTFRWQNPTHDKELFPFDVVSDLYIDTNPGFSNPQIITDIEDTSYSNTNLEGNQTYFWKVLARNSTGQTLWSEQQDRMFYLKGGTSVMSSQEPLPKAYALEQNYPNPFNACTCISYTIPHQENVRLEIFGIQGRLVRTLLSGVHDPGNYHIAFDASELPSGLYFCRLLAGSFTDVKRMLLLR
jgi:hypothetical protein